MNENKNGIRVSAQTGQLPFYWCGVYQSCKMSIFLHKTKPSNQILPEEKCVNCTILALKLNNTYNMDIFGEQLLTTQPN